METCLLVVIPLRIYRVPFKTVIQAGELIQSLLLLLCLGGDFLAVQDHLSSPSSSSQSPPPGTSNPSSSYSPMSNGSRESEYVPFTLEDLKIENSMDGGQYRKWAVKLQWSLE